VTFPAPVESDYALGVNLTKASDYGTLEFVLDPGTPSQVVLDNTDPTTNPAGNPIDAHASPTTAQYLFLGGVHLTQASHVLQVTVVGTTSTTGNMYNAGINYIAAAPVTGATTSSFMAAMNNLGLAADNGPALAQNFDLTNSATGGNLSRNALQAAGITAGTGTGAGSTFSLGGATFTMPQLRTDPATHAVIGDNVIPDGQSIQIPPVATTGVALLVTSTCGGSAAATATLGYSGARNDSPAIPAVGDWVSGATNVAVMQLGHYDSGSNNTPNSSHQPRLYEVMLPANPNMPVTSITLPVMPASFLTDTGTCLSAPTLHVLAIGFRPAASGPSAGGAWVGAYDAPMDTAIPQSPAITDRTFRESVPLSSPGNGVVRIHLSNACSRGSRAGGDGNRGSGVPGAQRHLLPDGDRLGRTREPGARSLEKVLKETVMCEQKLGTFNRIDLERIRLAAEVLLRLAEDGVIPDPLEAELVLLRDRVEHFLLLPGR
jgi:hypothetical protein